MLFIPSYSESIASLGVFGGESGWRGACELRCRSYPSGMTDDAGTTRDSAPWNSGGLPASEVGPPLADVALAAWRSGDRDLPAFRDRLRDAGCYATRELADNAATRSGDLSTWFALPELPFEELARRGRALRAAWAAAADPEERSGWRSSGEGGRGGRADHPHRGRRRLRTARTTTNPSASGTSTSSSGTWPAGGYSRFVWRGGHRGRSRSASGRRTATRSASRK